MAFVGEMGGSTARLKLGSTKVVLISDHNQDVMPALHEAGIQQKNIRFFHKPLSSCVPMEDDLQVIRPD